VIAKFFGTTRALRLLRRGGAGAVDACSDALHLVFAVELHFLELDFLQEIFGTKVRVGFDLLEFLFVLDVLFGQTLIVGVCLENYVPRVPLQHFHAFLLTDREWDFTAS
jgi:hypothetical protein